MMKILSIAQKDLLRSLRSLTAIGMMLVAPLLITGLIYFAFSGLARGGTDQLPPFHVLVVNKDNPTAGSPRLGDMMVDFLQDEHMPAFLSVSLEENENTAIEAVNQQKAGAVLVLPENFSRTLLEPQGTASLRLVHDPTLSVGPQVLTSLIGQFFDGVSGTRILVANLQANTNDAIDANVIQTAAGKYTNWYTALQNDIHHAAEPAIRFSSPSGERVQAAGTMNDMFAKTMAGMLIFFVFFSGATGAQAILREEEEMTLARVFSTPTNRSHILGGHFLATGVTIIAQSIVLLTASALIFDIEWGNRAALGLLIFSLAAAATGFGVFLISWLKNTRQAGAVIGGALCGLGILGGLFTTGVANLPAAYQTVNLLTPQGWALNGLKLLLAGGGVDEVLLPFLVLLAMGTVLFSIGAVRFNRRLAIK